MEDATGSKDVIGVIVSRLTVHQEERAREETVSEKPSQRTKGQIRTFENDRGQGFPQLLLLIL